MTTGSGCGRSSNNQARDKTGSRRLTDQLPIALTVDTPELLEAFDIFGLTWN